VIALTDTAADKVRTLIDAEGVPELALRVAVRPGGCSGYSYEMFFDADRAEDDLEVDFNGVQVVVDPSSGFSIENPNAQRTCGCGQSFS